MAGTLKNFYETLGVSRSATDEQIKTAYRKLILKFHPDKNVGDAYFEDWSKKIIEAFEVLSDPQLRAEYDQVYDEHKRAAKRTFQEASTTAPDPEPAAASKPEPSPVAEPFSPDNEEQMEDADYERDEFGQEEQQDSEPAVQDLAGDEPEIAAISAQVDAYITAKQQYLRAEKDFKTLKQQKPARSSSKISWPLIIICLLLIVGAIIWMVNAPAEEKVKAVPKGTVTLITSQVMIVSAPKAFFYEDPQNLVKTNKYVTAGNKVSVSKKYKNYYYAVFHSIADPNYQVAGWVSEGDLQK